MLTEADAAAMEAWLTGAKAWSEASQELVGAAAALSLSSRVLADELHGNGVQLSIDERRRRGRLADELRVLATTVEDETQILRDGYLETAARIAGYEDLLG